MTLLSTINYSCEDYPWHTLCSLHCEFLNPGLSSLSADLGYVMWNTLAHYRLSDRGQRANRPASYRAQSSPSEQAWSQAGRCRTRCIIKCVRCDRCSETGVAKFSQEKDRKELQWDEDTWWVLETEWVLRSGGNEKSFYAEHKQRQKIHCAIFILFSVTMGWAGGQRAMQWLTRDRAGKISREVASTGLPCFGIGRERKEFSSDDKQLSVVAKTGSNGGETFSGERECVHFGTVLCHGAESRKGVITVNTHTWVPRWLLLGYSSATANRVLSHTLHYIRLVSVICVGSFFFFF